MKCKMWTVKSEVWTMKCELWSLKYEVWSMKCEIWSLNYKVWSVNYEVWTVKCEVWSLNYEVWSMKCEVWTILRDFRNAPVYIHCFFHMNDFRMFSLCVFILLLNGPWFAMISICYCCSFWGNIDISVFQQLSSDKCDLIRFKNKDF